jgi:hypothetical protein
MKYNYNVVKICLPDYCEGSYEVESNHEHIEEAMKECDRQEALHEDDDECWFDVVCVRK